jgi:hypothetical protein
MLQERVVLLALIQFEVVDEIVELLHQMQPPSPSPKCPKESVITHIVSGPPFPGQGKCRERIDVVCITISHKKKLRTRECIVEQLVDLKVTPAFQPFSDATISNFS